jgi:hypothetical protein
VAGSHLRFSKEFKAILLDLSTNTVEGMRLKLKKSFSNSTAFGVKRLKTYKLNMYNIKG